MSTITAIIGDTSTIGAAAANSDPTSTTLHRRNPQLATARIRTVVAPHTVQDATGGYISADFTIPAEEAQRWRPVLRYGAVCWLFDGHSPIFFGYLEQPVWTTTGDCQVTLSGPWQVLSRSRCREAWEQIDLSQLRKGTGGHENKSGQVNVNNDNSLTLSIPAGTLAGNDTCSADYLLFGEIVEANDGRLITAFEVDISDSQNLAATRHFRVTGKASAAATTGDQLYDITSGTGSSGIQSAQNLHGTNQGAAPWTSADGYRCLRFELINSNGTSSTIAADWYVTLDRIRISTREAMFPAAGSDTLDTAAIARDILTIKGTIPQGRDFPQEFWRSALLLTGTDTDTFPYKYGRDPVIGTGSAPNSGVGISGFSSLAWQSPADIITELAAIDGSNVGFYLPYNQRGGYDPAGTGGADAGSWWLSAPPQLVYQPFPDPNYSPDYTIQTRQGAVVEPQSDVQPLADVLYTNFQSVSGRQLSEVVEDDNTLNYLYAQGFRRADDYSVAPPVGPATATSIGAQALSARRQPIANATITITNDALNRSPILKGGATVTKLATIRPGSVRITDVPVSTGLRAGYATHVEWWGQTLTSNEYVQITLSAPGTLKLDRRLAQLALRRNHQRVQVLPT